ADANGTVEVDASSTLELRTTTFNNGTFINSGLLEATVGANAIHAASSISNNSGATLEVTGAGVTPTIDNAVAFPNAATPLATYSLTLHDALPTFADANGTVEVDGSSTLELRTTTFNNGTFINSGLLEATVGANAIHAASSISNNSGATLEV